MKQELIVTNQERALAPVVTDDQIDLIKRTVAKDATDAELQLYLYDCQRHGVHPLDKLLHFTKRSNKYTPITSIDLLRSRAADTGELAGIDDASYTGEAGGNGFTARVTVYRFVQGQKCAFTATARWSEYKPDQNDFMWKRMPYLMLGKCSEALALRKAFPRQLSGLYVREEMEQANNRQIDTTTGEIRGPFDPRPARSAIAALAGATPADIAAAADLDDQELLRDLYKQVRDRSKNGNGKHAPSPEQDELYNEIETATAEVSTR